MAHKSYEEAKKGVYKGLILLGVVTLAEVFISLFGKGHVIKGVEDIHIIFLISAFLIVALSLYKAYFIIYEFMHMAYEVPGLRMTVLLPTTLLIWGMIAFFQEGDSWGERREKIKELNNKEVKETIKLQEGMIYNIPNDYTPFG